MFFAFGDEKSDDFLVNFRIRQPFIVFFLYILFTLTNSSLCVHDRLCVCLSVNVHAYCIWLLVFFLVFYYFRFSFFHTLHMMNISRNARWPLHILLFLQTWTTINAEYLLFSSREWREIVPHKMFVHIDTYMDYLVDEWYECNDGSGGGDDRRSRSLSVLALNMSISIAGQRKHAIKKIGFSRQRPIRNKKN